MMFLALKRYAEFHGRSSRSEFWLFVLLQLLVSIGLAILPFFALSYGLKGVVAAGQVTRLAGMVISLAFLVPSLSVMVRRLHDTDRSGWWGLLLVPLQLYGMTASFTGMIIQQSYFGNARAAWSLYATAMSNPAFVAWMKMAPMIGLAGLAGVIILIVFLAMKGSSGDNRFGSDPLNGPVVSRTSSDEMADVDVPAAPRTVPQRPEYQPSTYASARTAAPSFGKRR